MVKAYLRYEHSQSFGIIASSDCNAIFDDTGELIYTGCDECAVSWRSRQNRLCKCLKVPSFPPHETFYSSVVFLALSPLHRHHLAVGYTNGSIRIWDIDEEKILLTFHGHKSAISFLAFSRSGCYLASGSNDTDIILYDIVSECGLYRLRGHQDRVTCVKFIEPPMSFDTDTLRNDSALKNSPPHYLVSGSKDGFVKIWSMDTQSCIQTLVDASGDIWCLDINDDVTRLVTASADNLLRVYALDMSKSLLESTEGSHGAAPYQMPANGLPELAVLLGTLKRPKGKQRITCMQFCVFPEEQALSESATRKRGFVESIDDFTRPSGITKSGLLLCGGRSKNVEVYRVYSEQEKRKRTKRRYKRIREKQKKKCESLKALLQTLEKKLQVEGYKMGRHEHQLMQAEGEALEREISKLQGIIAAPDKEEYKGFAEDNSDSLLSDEMMYLCSICTHCRVVGFDVFMATPNILGSHTKQNHKLLLALSNNTIEIKRLPHVRYFDKLKKSDTSQDLDADSSLAIPHFSAVCDDLHAVEWAGHSSSVRSLNTSPDDALILSVSDDCIKVWTSASSQCVSTIPCNFGLCGFFVAGNDYVVIGNKFGDIELLDLRKCCVSQTLHAHTDAVQQLCETTDHAGFASISYDKSLKTYNLYTETSTTAYATSTSVIIKESLSHPLGDKGLDIKYSHNGKFLAVALLDSTLQLFYSDTMKLFLTLYAHKLPVLSIDFSTDDTLLASGSVDKSVKLWNTDFGNVLKSLRSHSEAVTQVRWLHDTHYLLTTSRDCTIKLWDCDHHQLITQLLGHPKPITCVACSFDAAFFVTGGGTQSIRHWVRTSQQLFIEEERDKELDAQMEQEGIRDDLINGTSMAHSEMLWNRPTRKTVDTVRSTEKLMEMLDEAVEQYELDCLYYKELNAYKSAKEKSAHPSLGTSLSTLEGLIESNKKPVKPVPKPELCGKSPLEFILIALSTLKSTSIYEVLIALPFLYAEKALYELKWTGLKPSDTLQEPILCYPIENPCKCALVLLQVHFRTFMASPSHRRVLLKLRDYMRPLLLSEKEQFGMNLAALSFLKQQVENEQSIVDASRTIQKQQPTNIAANKSVARKSHKKRKLTHLAST